ncbi:MAG: endonuclease/exonuclease/phosphatase family protein, partial [Flavobacteriales bacterium]
MRVLLTMLLLSGMNAIAQPYRLMTYNIRYDNPQDGDDRWSLRGKGLIGLIRKSDPDALGLQEVLASQLSDISKEMKGYESIGVGRDDGAQAGEYAPLFIRTKRFAIRSSGWFWLSDTPDEPGKGWDAACNRISTWAIVKDKSAKRDLLIINTHLDHVGKVAR